MERDIGESQPRAPSNELEEVGRGSAVAAGGCPPAKQAGQPAGPGRASRKEPACKKPAREARESQPGGASPNQGLSWRSWAGLSFWAGLGSARLKTKNGAFRRPKTGPLNPVRKSLCHNLLRRQPPFATGSADIYICSIHTYIYVCISVSILYVQQSFMAPLISKRVPMPHLMAHGKVLGLSRV